MLFYNKKDYIEMNFNDFKKLLNEEDTQNLKQMTTKKDGYPVILETSSFTSKNKSDIWVCEKKCFK